MLDNKTFIINESIKTVDKQFRDPETLSPEGFQLYIRESEQLRQIEKDIQEEVSNLE